MSGSVRTTRVRELPVVATRSVLLLLLPSFSTSIFPYASVMSEAGRRALNLSTRCWRWPPCVIEWLRLSFEAVGLGKFVAEAAGETMPWVGLLARDPLTLANVPWRVWRSRELTSSSWGFIVNMARTSSLSYSPARRLSAMFGRRRCLWIASWILWNQKCMCSVVANWISIVLCSQLTDFLHHSWPLITSVPPAPDPESRFESASLRPFEPFAFPGLPCFSWCWSQTAPSFRLTLHWRVERQTASVITTLSFLASVFESSRTWTFSSSSPAPPPASSSSFLPPAESMLALRRPRPTFWSIACCICRRTCELETSMIHRRLYIAGLYIEVMNPPRSFFTEHSSARWSLSRRLKPTRTLLNEETYRERSSSSCGSRSSAACSSRSFAHFSERVFRLFFFRWCRFVTCWFTLWMILQNASIVLYDPSAIRNCRGVSNNSFCSRS
mmetsp:Transcript_18070/g.44277  ORF Transcript_18070/g.44277 Transcript_18070/m.44277 type:complete len:441 (+) Transcript_18070:2206-3528(+)